MMIEYKLLGLSGENGIPITRILIRFRDGEQMSFESELLYSGLHNRDDQIFEFLPQTVFSRFADCINATECEDLRPKMETGWQPIYYQGINEYYSIFRTVLSICAKADNISVHSEGSAQAGFLLVFNYYGKRVSYPANKKTIPSLKEQISSWMGEELLPTEHLKINKSNESTEGIISATVTLTAIAVAALKVLEVTNETINQWIKVREEIRKQEVHERQMEVLRHQQIASEREARRTRVIHDSGGHIGSGGGGALRLRTADF